MLTKAAVNNPAGVAVGVALIALLGLFTIFSLPVQLFPDIDRPKIAIEVNWRAAAPEEVESEILEPIEHELRGIPGLKELHGFAGQGGAFLELTFSLETDMTKTRMDIIDRLNRVPPLPADADPPVTQLGGGRGFGADANLALSYFYVQLKDGNPNSIESYQKLIEDRVMTRIEAVPGVAGVSLNAGAPRQLRIEVDPFKAAQYGIPISDIATLAGRANNVSGGFVDIGRRQYLMRFTGRYKVEELSQLVLAWRNDKPVYLGDIAKVEVARGKRRSFTYQNGYPALSFRVDRQSGANVLATLSEVKTVVAELRDGVLADNRLSIEISFDPSVFINRAIRLVSGNLLAGVAFAVGMVVDAAIVVLENIVRLRQQTATGPSIEGARRRVLTLP